jgi:hypothetical protein
VPEWDFDPANLSTVASDNNSCTSTAHPCLTFAEIVSRWTTYEPYFPQNTLVRQMSGQTTDADVVDVRVHTKGAFSFSYVCTPVVVTSGTLAGVSPKTVGTAGSGTPLEATFTGVAAGELVVNSTRANSVAFLMRNPSGTTWMLSQPLAAATLPPSGFGSTYRAENNAWANGDSYQVLSLPGSFMTNWSPSFDTENGPGTNLPVLQDCTILDTTAFSPFVVRGTGGYIQDVSIQRVLQLLGTLNGSYFTNVDFVGQMQVINSWGNASGLVGFAGGDVRNTFTNICFGCDIGFDFSMMTSGSIFFQAGGRYGFLGTATGDGLYVDTGATWQASGHGVLRAAATGLAPLYGPGTLNVGGSSSFNLAQATGVVLVGVWTMNGLGTACAQSNVTPSVINCGITLTPAHYDAAFGVAGFGGVAKSFFTSATIQNSVNN